MTLVPDHLMWGAPSLERGIEVAEALFGVRAALGGSHAGRGTCNALLSLGDAVYLEILAPDPQQSGQHDLALQLASLNEPALITWAVASRDLPAVAAAATQAGLATSGPVVFERGNPQGEMMAWELLFPRDHSYGGLMPFFIDWLQCTHPAGVSPRAGVLQQLILHSPKAEALTGLFRALGSNIVVQPSAEPAITARIRTANGEVNLISSAESISLRL